jgi:glucose-6-phosphate 1-dehydrogenase
MEKGNGAEPHVVVLFGATGDLARRKLLPGLYHLSISKLAPEIRIVGISLDDLDDDAFRALAVKACREFCRDKITDEALDQFTANLTYLSSQAGSEALATSVQEQMKALGGGARLLHYLSVPPAAAKAVLETLHNAGLVECSRVIMEKPFGTD